MHAAGRVTARPERIPWPEAATAMFSPEIVLPPC